MIKVVQISFSVQGGAGIAAYRLHKGLLKSGLCSSVFICHDAGPYKNNVDILEIKAPTRKKTILERIGRRLGLIVNYKLMETPGDHEAVTWPESDYRIELEQEVLNADIIHLHWVSGFLNFPSFFKKLEKKKIVWTLHDMNPFMGIFHYKGDQVRNPMLKAADAKALAIKTTSLKRSKLNIVALSNWISSEAKTNPVFRKFTFTNIPNGIDFGTFYPIDRNLARKELNIPENETVILIVAENVTNYRKGIDILITSLSLIKSTGPIRIISVGKGELDLPSNFQYVSFGIITDPPKLATIYSSSNLFVIPSREDNLPNVMLEAFACGIPIVGFPVGGINQHIIPHLTGILAEPVSEVGLAKAIDEFILNPNAFDRKKINEYARSLFDDKLQAVAHIDLYTKLLL
jgi:glycosyltransferase involved in cell wall biosynthesis